MHSECAGKEHQGFDSNKEPAASTQPPGACPGPPKGDSGGDQKSSPPQTNTQCFPPRRRSSPALGTRPPRVPAAAVAHCRSRDRAGYRGRRHCMPAPALAARGTVHALSGADPRTGRRTWRRRSWCTSLKRRHGRRGGDGVEGVLVPAAPPRQGDCGGDAETP